MNDVLEDYNGNGPAELRKAHKALKKQNEDLLARLANLEGLQNGRSVRDALAARGLNPQVAKFYPAGEPTTDESVDKWVEENRELFGVQKPKLPDLDQTDIPEHVRRGYEQMKHLQAAEAYTEMDFQSKLDACESPEEVLALLKDYSPPGS